MCAPAKALTLARIQVMAKIIDRFRNSLIAYIPIRLMFVKRRAAVDPVGF